MRYRRAVTSLLFVLATQFQCRKLKQTLPVVGAVEDRAAGEPADGVGIELVAITNRALAVDARQGARGRVHDGATDARGIKGAMHMVDVPKYARERENGSRV